VLDERLRAVEVERVDDVDEEQRRGGAVWSG
jgi:hypothetical protein